MSRWLFALVVAFLATSAQAGSASLTWEAPTTRTDGSALTNLAGFRIYYSSNPAGPWTSVTVPGGAAARAFVVDNLAPATWYFAATAFDAAGIESARTVPVTKTVTGTPPDPWQSNIAIQWQASAPPTGPPAGPPSMGYLAGYLDDQDSGASSAVIADVVVPAGHSVLLWMIYDGGSAGTPTPSTASIGGTWEAISGATLNDGGNSGFIRAWLNRTPNEGTHEITVAKGITGGHVAKALVFSAVPTAGAIGDVAAGASQTQNPPAAGADGQTSGSFTAPAGSWLLFGFGVDWSVGGAPAAGTGFVDLGLTGNFGGDPYTAAEIGAGTGAVSVAATFTRASASRHYTTGIAIATTDPVLERVQTDGADGGGDVDEATMTLASTPVEGNLLVVSAFQRSGVSASVATISGSGWTKRVSKDYALGDGNTRHALAIWEKVAGASEPSVITVTWTGAGNITAHAAEYGADVPVTWAFEELATGDDDNGALYDRLSITATTASVGAGSNLLVGTVGWKGDNAPGGTLGLGSWTAEALAGGEESHFPVISFPAIIETAWGQSNLAGAKSTTWDDNDDSTSGIAGSLALLVYSATPASAGGLIARAPDLRGGLGSLSANLQ